MLDMGTGLSLFRMPQKALVLGPFGGNQAHPISHGVLGVVGSGDARLSWGGNSP